MFKVIKRMFINPPAYELAVEEHAKAHRSLLAHQSDEEYSRAMVQYNKERICRLEDYINDNHPHMIEVVLTEIN